jgi:hypothetical protein
MREKVVCIDEGSSKRMLKVLRDRLRAATGSHRLTRQGGEVKDI